MYVESVDSVQPAVFTIQNMLQKIDRLHLPSASRHDLESILVRQVTKELDRLLPWQAGHGEATAVVAFRIGVAMRLHDQVLHQLKLAALLHDIGLLMLPSHLQAGRGPLDADTYATIQNHPRLGSVLLEPFLFLRDATVMIAHHHEQWDGSGYPYGLRGETIPLGARILAVADSFQAIQIPHVHNRSVRDRTALRILQVAAGTQFDPTIVEVLIQIFREATVEPVSSAGYQPYPRRTSCAGLEVGVPSSHFTRQGASPPEASCRPNPTMGGPRA